MTTHPPAASAPRSEPTVLDTGRRLPRALRPRARDLPALAWLTARGAGPTDGTLVDPWRAAAFLPACLLALVAEHAAGALAARGRHALVGLSPTGPAGRGYRATRTAAILGGAVILLAMIVAVPVGALLVPLAVPQLDRAAPSAAVSLMALWGAGLLTQPAVAAGIRQVRMRGARRPITEPASWWRTPWSGVAGPRWPPPASAWR